MSYSFSSQAATKAEVLKKVAAEFDHVVGQQPVHAADKEQVLAAVTAFVNLLRDDETLDVIVSVTGSIYVPESGVQNAGISINAAFTKKAS